MSSLSQLKLHFFKSYNHYILVIKQQTKVEAYVNIELIKEGIAEITFFHPKSNAMPGDLLAKLAQTISHAGADNKIKIIILKSGGDKAFCAGASFHELIQINDISSGKAFFLGFAKVINAIRTSQKLVIGRVHGKAVGGGVGLAAAVDYCLATEASEIKLSELNIGIGPFVIEPAVTRKIGLAAFTELTLNPDQFYSAEWAKQQGLFSSVYSSVEQLDSQLSKLSESLASKNPDALQAIKKTLWRGTEAWDQLLEERAEQSGNLVRSEFTKQALAQFK